MTEACNRTLLKNLLRLVGQAIAVQRERSFHNRIMGSTNISMSSTKADIVDAASELIGDLEGKLETQTKLHTASKEERDVVLILLAITSIFTILF